MIKEIELDQRLQEIAQRTVSCMHVADIGADHGHLACWLLEHNEKMRMTVSDVSAPSLEKAKKLLTERGHTHRVQLRVADGLDSITEEVDAIVIAGMGAKTIREILTAGREKIGAARLLLQPNLDVPRLRAFLHEAGFVVLDETALHAAGRHYMLIEARLKREDEGCKAVLSERDAFLGECLCQKTDEDTKLFYAWQREVRTSELTRLKAMKLETPHALAREAELEREIAWLGEVL